MTRPSQTRIEMPWELEGRMMLIAGDVTLRPKTPYVEGFRCIDMRTEDDLELASPDQDTAEDALIEEALTIWRTP